METYSASAGDIVRLSRKVSDPVAAYSAPDAVFQIYRVKDLYRRSWNNSALKSLVRISRGTYSRYGKRPAFDKYDTKAAIYLVRASYRAKGIGGKIEEWLTIRMVPGDKRPVGVAEPEIYFRAGKPMDYWMKRKIGAKDFWRHVASSSRMCGIHPYIISGHGSPQFLENSGHRYTPICFALIHKQFVTDYPLDRFPYEYITAMIRPDFYKRGLSFASGRRMVRPAQISASAFLGFKRREIHVDRETYSYPFPLYWLDNKKLLHLVNTLRKEQNQAPLSVLDSKMFAKLPEKSEKPVDIAGLRIEPGKMRKLIDRFVPDVPELKITPAKPWYRSMDSLLKAARVRPAEGMLKLN